MAAMLRHAAACDDLSELSALFLATAPRRAPVHPLVLKAAETHRLGTDRAPGRLGSWVNTSRLFHMTHIAKTGGRSVRSEMLRLVRPVGGAEQCYPPFAHASRVNVIFFREPRGHVLSQYLHGAYAGKAAKRRAAGFPHVDGDDIAGLARWAAHFARGWTPAAGDFLGYNPLNMMARTLTCRDERWNCDYITSCDAPCAHHVGQDAADATPPLGAALAAVHTADFVGVLELLPEALCLFEYRATGALPASCRCADGGGGADESGGEPSRGRAHVMNARSQRSRAKKVTMADAPPEVLADVDAITAVDAKVYRAAVLRLLCDIRALEEAAVARVLCPAREAARRHQLHPAAVGPRRECEREVRRLGRGMASIFTSFRLACHIAPRSTLHTTHIPRIHTRDTLDHMLRSSSWPVHERPVLLDERRDAPRGRATRPRVRWFSPPRRRWPASPRWSRATGWRRPKSAAGGPTGCATRSRGCAGGRTGAASRRPCLRAPEMHGMRGGGAIILEAQSAEGGRAGQTNCARRAPRAPTSSSTARRASRSSSSAEGSPLVIRSHPSLRMALSKSERRWTARGAAARSSTTRPRGVVVDPRRLGRRFSPRERVVASLSPHLGR